MNEISIKISFNYKYLNIYFNVQKVLEALFT